MKKILSATLACLLLVSMVLALASCGGAISGTYEAEMGGMKQTLKFSGSKVTMTMTVGDESEEVKYSYELNEDETKITLTMDEDLLKDKIGEEAFNALTDEQKAEALSTTVSFEKGEDFIKIGGTEYKKK